MRADGVDAYGFIGDATDEATVARITHEVATQLGQIDILVNNAGIGVKPAYQVANMPVDAWDSMIHSHMKSTFLWSRAVIPFMEKMQ